MSQENFAERAVAFDTETALIIPGNVAPPLVCGSMAHAFPARAEFLDARGACEVFHTTLTAKRRDIIVGANIAYDMIVMANDAYQRSVEEGDALLAAIFAKYARGEVYDVQLAEALNAIAGGHLFRDPKTGGELMDPATKRRGRYSLSICVHQVLGRTDAKANDLWRKRYAILAGVPLEHWPDVAIQYPKDDARNTLEVALAQVARHRNLKCMPAQAEAAFALALVGAQGVRTERAAVEALDARVTKEREEGAGQWIAVGFLTRPPCGVCGHVFEIHSKFHDGVESCGGQVGRGKKALPCDCTGYDTAGVEEAEDKKAGRVVKAALARAYGAAGPCPSCNGTGKVRNAKGNAYVFCTDKNLAGRTFDGPPSPHIDGSLVPPDPTQIPMRGCDGTGLDLGRAPLLARTPTGNVKAGRDELLESGDEQLMGFSEYLEDDKLVSVYLPFLKSGMDRPINIRYNPLLESARASADGVSMLLPRDGGVRECIIPEPGRVFCSTDYSSGELVTFAQVQLWILGRSKMAQVINETKDPGALHVLFAADMAGISFDEGKKRYKAGDKQMKDYRQAAKAGNYGFGGGMGAPKFTLSKRKKAEGKTTAPDGKVYNGIRFCILLGGATRCGVNMITEWRERETAPVCRDCVVQVESLKQQWLTTWDIRGYFEWVSRQVDLSGQMATCPCGMVRGGLSFCDGANHNFQHLLACGAKRSLCFIIREMYDVKSSPLYGNRANMFAHDDVFSSLWEGGASDAGKRQAALMIEGLKEFCPDVYVGCEPALMRRWSKSAETVWGPNGELLVWEPKEKKAA